ncbi:MAG: DUF4340 domain-containing protein [Thermodesulfobacteriota bacterium]
MAQSKDMKSYLVKFAGTFIGAIVLIVLLGYLYFFEIRKEGEKAKRENVFPVIKKEQINEIIFKYPFNKVVCQKESGIWFVLKDTKKLNAENKVIRSIIENIATMKIEKVASETITDLSGFGIGSPEVEVIAKTPDSEYRILIGGESPVGSGRYVRIDNESKILLVSRGSVREFLGKSANDLRDKQVLSSNEDEIKRIKFKWRDSSFEVERKNENWIGKDIPDYIDFDQSRILAILRTFVNLKIDNFEDDEPNNLAAYGLDKPRAEIDLFQDGKPVRVLFGNKKESGDYYVKLGSDNSVYSVSEFVLRQIPESVNDIRVRRIMKLDAEKISGVEINRGDNKISILKEGYKWKLGGDNSKKVDESKVGELIADIGSLEVEEFVDDNPNDLSPYGIDKPEIELTILESDKKRTVFFGKIEKDKVYVKFADGKSVYLVGDNIISKIPSSSEELIRK